MSTRSLYRKSARTSELSTSASRSRIGANFRLSFLHSYIVYIGAIFFYLVIIYFFFIETKVRPKPGYSIDVYPSAHADLLLLPRPLQGYTAEEVSLLLDQPKGQRTVVKELAVAAGEDKLTAKELQLEHREIA